MALVLTHELALLAERIPYLAAKWFPMPVLNIYGRPAAMEPETGRHLAVFYGWRDHIPILILSGTLMPGTLFIVAEQDWRIEKRDSLVN